MYDQKRLREMFPRASQSFIDANAELRASQPERAARETLVDPVPGEKKSDARIIVRYVLYRVRLLDPDNAFGSTKTLTDCLCQVGILPGDTSEEIEVEVHQEKVHHLADQRTTVSIKYP